MSRPARLLTALVVVLAALSAPALTSPASADPPAAQPGPCAEAAINTLDRPDLPNNAVYYDENNFYHRNTWGDVPSDSVEQNDHPCVPTQNSRLHVDFTAPQSVSGTQTATTTMTITQTPVTYSYADDNGNVSSVTTAPSDDIVMSGSSFDVSGAAYLPEVTNVACPAQVAVNYYDDDYDFSSNGLAQFSCQVTLEEFKVPDNATVWEGFEIWSCIAASGPAAHCGILSEVGSVVNVPAYRTQAPTAAITYTPKGCGSPHAFVFDGTNSVANTSGATITTYAWDFGDGSTAAGATVTHTFKTDADQHVTLTVIDSTGATATQSTDLSPHLSVTTVASDPSPVPTDSPFTESVTVLNDGTKSVTAVTPTVSSSDTAEATLASGSTPANADLASGCSQTYTFTGASGHAPGFATLTIGGSGTAAGDTVTIADVQRILRVGTGLTMTLAAAPKETQVNQAATVTATLTNHTEKALTAITPSLTSSPTTGVTVGAPTPSSVSLDPHASATVSWTVTGTSAGVYALKATAAYTDPDFGPSSSTATLSLAVGAIIVNSTADTALPSSATRCDVDPNTTGDQCTLRAAIQFANTLSSPAVIGFDIAGGGTPTIAPATALPVATNSVTLDATTQTGGWVVLSGAAQSGGNGLEVDGGNSVVRGLVVNGFTTGAGLLAAGTAGHQHLVGNRVGTDATGTSAVANTYGILVDAPDVTVGGTAGTSATSCTGDCNLVAGNTGAQITNYDRGAAQPSYADVTVQGDWVGLDASGTKSLPASGSANGIDVRWGPSTVFSAADPVIVGGSTARPGTAPGNVVAAPSSGVVVASNSGSGGSRAGTAAVRGNLIGLDPSGTRAVGTGQYGISAAGADLSSLDSIVIGGDDTASMNVVSGWNTGISQSQGALVDGNRIGTSADGQHAVPNQQGIASASAAGSEIRNNLISGNGVGVAGYSAYLTRGNVIGLAADGTTALPNGTGVGTTAPESGDGTLTIGVGHDGKPLTCTGPCNVISGNRTAGVRIGSPYVPGIEIAGTYIGTDRTGTKAVPNGIGVSLEAPALAEAKLGAASTVTRTSTCAAPCNLIAGNTGAGIAIAVSGGGDVGAGSTPGRIEGNALGVTVTGRALPNGGGDITVTGKPTDVGIVVGGSTTQGNLLASTDKPAIDIGGTSGSYPTVAAEGNAFHLGGSGLPIHRPSGSVLAPVGTVAKTSTGVIVSGSTNSTGDPVKHAETVEIYGATSCTASVRTPIATTSVRRLNGDFSIEITKKMLAGRSAFFAVRTDQDDNSSRFSSCATKVSAPGTSASSVKAGGAVTVTGDAFSPGETVTVTLHSKPVKLKTVRVAKGGVASVKVVIPKSAAVGKHHLILTGSRSHRSVSYPITVKKRT